MGFEIVMIVFNKASYEFLWLLNTGYNSWLKMRKIPAHFNKLNLLMEDGGVDRTEIVDGTTILAKWQTFLPF